MTIYCIKLFFCHKKFIRREQTETEAQDIILSY